MPSAASVYVMPEATADACLILHVFAPWSGHLEGQTVGPTSCRFSKVIENVAGFGKWLARQIKHLLMRGRLRLKGGKTMAISVAGRNNVAGFGG